MGIQNAHAEPVTVFNRSNPEYNVDKFIGKRTENSCRLSIISYFENDGCMRAISRGDLEIEYLKCADGNNHKNLSNYYIIYDNSFLETFAGNTPSENSDASKVYCSDPNYTIFEWNIYKIEN